MNIKDDPLGDGNSSTSENVRNQAILEMGVPENVPYDYFTKSA